jgi:hypothetical protein
MAQSKSGSQPAHKGGKKPCKAARRGRTRRRALGLTPNAVSRLIVRAQAGRDKCGSTCLGASVGAKNAQASDHSGMLQRTEAESASRRRPLQQPLPQPARGRAHHRHRCSTHTVHFMLVLCTDVRPAANAACLSASLHCPRVGFVSAGGACASPTGLTSSHEANRQLTATGLPVWWFARGVTGSVGSKRVGTTGAMSPGAFTAHGRTKSSSGSERGGGAQRTAYHSDRRMDTVPHHRKQCATATAGRAAAVAAARSTTSSCSVSHHHRHLPSLMLLLFWRCCLCLLSSFSCSSQGSGTVGMPNMA